MTFQYRIGDRVRLTDECAFKGHTGTVSRIVDETACLVTWDRNHVWYRTADPAHHDIPDNNRILFTRLEPEYAATAREHKGLANYYHDLLKAQEEIEPCTIKSFRATSG